MATMQTNMKRVQRHGLTRGDQLSRASLLFEGRFGRIFRTLPAADFGPDEGGNQRALTALAKEMIRPAEPLADHALPGESGIPAAYTYFAQFIDHDLTFDPASSLERQNDPDGLVDYRTPRFDLDSVYGRGATDQPYLYDDGRSFLFGRPLVGGGKYNDTPCDLPRTRGTKRLAVIGDPRNDANVIISQLHGLMMRFHNRIAARLPGFTFEAVQRVVRFHYQWVIFKDFLPKIVSTEALMSVFPEGLTTGLATLAATPRKFFKWRDSNYMPLEFSAAAYRFGHSMVRPGYRLNDGVGPLPVFGEDPDQSLIGFREFARNWAIDWSLFIDLESRPAEGKTRLQLASTIDTSISHPLGQLGLVLPNGPSSLAARNLLRGWRLRLPSGQDVARAMGLSPLEDEEITIGAAANSAAEIDRVYADNCPLWLYILAETVETELPVTRSEGVQMVSTRQLGPVGGRIVAETILGLLQGDSSSVLSQDPTWTPFETESGNFGLRELIKIALET
jgi:hypothetical protein